MTQMSVAVGPLLALVAVLGLYWPASQLAHRFQHVDRPDQRKLHESAIPLIGGPLIGVGVLAASFISGLFQHEQVRWLLLATGTMGIVGLLDDRYDVPPPVRLAVQLAVGLMMAWPAGVEIHRLGNLLGFGEIGLGPLAIPFTVICVVAMINALNMLDGVDGLAGGLALVALAWLAVAAALIGDSVGLALALIVAGACAGFLWFNARRPGQPRARCFLGDAGSMSLGVALVWLAVRLAEQPQPAMAPIAACWILAVPLLDVMTMTVRRARLGRHPFSPDREHSHHLLLAAGLAPGRTVAAFWGLGLLMGGVGVGGWWFGWPEPVLAAGFVALVIGHYVLVHRAWRFVRALRRLRRRREYRASLRASS